MRQSDHPIKNFRVFSCGSWLKNSTLPTGRFSAIALAKEGNGIILLTFSLRVVAAKMFPAAVTDMVTQSCGYFFIFVNIPCT
jgi:hypothetical protein